jgi:hypothetical protein
MISCLCNISQNNDDDRHARALFELGVCRLSGFGDPEACDEKMGLQLIFEAAKAGELVAKGYAKQLSFLLDSGVEDLAVDESILAQWTYEAAINGHQTAFDIYRSSGKGKSRSSTDISQSHMMQKRYGSKQIPSLVANVSDTLSWIAGGTNLKVPINSTQDTVLHWACQTDRTDIVVYLLNNQEVRINAKNKLGDTALIAACEVGNLSTAQLLLQYGADIRISNNFGETPLHHLWRFTDPDALEFLEPLFGSDIFETAYFTESFLEFTSEGQIYRKEGSVPSELDCLPLLPGLAIERLLGRGRETLLKKMLLCGPPLNPDADHGQAANGNLIRRMVLWASRLNFVGIRDFLVQFSRSPRNFREDADVLPEVVDIEHSRWTFRHDTLDYMSGVALGWVGSRGAGWNVPEKFWRLCVHGRDWRNAMVSTIRHISESSDKPPCCFEFSLGHAIAIRHHEFTIAFLRLIESCFADFAKPTMQHVCMRLPDPQTRYSGFDYLPSEDG